MSFPIDPPLPCSPGWLLAGAALLLLTGCTTLPPAPVPPPPAPAPTPTAPVLPAPALAPAPPPLSPPAPAPAPDPVQAESDAASRRLLAFHERLREMGPADLAREVARLGEPTDPAARMELALVLAQTRQNGDLARALALVEPLARANAAAPAAPTQRLARLLHARLADQRRLEEQVERQNQQLRDQQRRLDQLANQIEALRAIERSLSTRPAAPPAAPGAAGSPGATPR